MYVKFVYFKFMIIRFWEIFDIKQGRSNARLQRSSGQQSWPKKKRKKLSFNWSDSIWLNVKRDLNSKKSVLNDKETSSSHPGLDASDSFASHNASFNKTSRLLPKNGLLPTPPPTNDKESAYELSSNNRMIPAASLCIPQNGSWSGVTSKRIFFVPVFKIADTPFSDR